MKTDNPLAHREDCQCDACKSWFSNAKAHKMTGRCLRCAGPIDDHDGVDLPYPVCRKAVA